jgi:hypothetical protein
MTLRTLGLALLAAALSGCGLAYTDVHMPLAYRAATPAEVKSSPSDKAVSGSACARSILFLAAWGDAGYAAACRDALKDEPPNAMLYDVKSDRSGRSYLLGLYAQVCTRLTGRVAVP